MSDVQIDVGFNVLEEDYPDSFYGYWQMILTRDAWELYDLLVTIAKQEGSFTTSANRLSKNLGISKSRLMKIVEELQGYGFIAFIGS